MNDPYAALYQRDSIVTTERVFGRVRDYGALREAIDMNPHLRSARLNNDHHAIMVELNKYLPDGCLITVEDVKAAMELYPVPALTGIVVPATGRATGKGGI